MAFAKQLLFMVPFTLPDGEHILAVRATTIGRARVVAQRTFAQNPEVQWDHTQLKEATVDDINKAEAQLRARDPSRPLANDFGFDTPNRVLTNPEVVPGSNFVPDAQGLADQK